MSVVRENRRFSFFFKQNDLSTFCVEEEERRERRVGEAGDTGEWRFREKEEVLH